MRRLTEGNSTAGGHATTADARSGSATAGDDDDVVDATEEYQQAKRQRQAAETIDLDTFKVNPMLIAQENTAVQLQPGTGQVKVETSL